MASSFHFHGTMGRRRFAIADVLKRTESNSLLPSILPGMVIESNSPLPSIESNSPLSSILPGMVTRSNEEQAEAKMTSIESNSPLPSILPGMVTRSNEEQAEAKIVRARKAMSGGLLEVQEIIQYESEEMNTGSNSESEEMNTGSNGMTHASKPPSLDTHASNPTLNSALATLLQVSRDRSDGEARRRKEAG